MKRLFIALSLIGVLALGTAETAAIAADVEVSEPAPRHIARTHRHGARRVVLSRSIYRPVGSPPNARRFPNCIEVSQPPRGCRLHHYARLPWPGVPTLYAEETAEYPTYVWHRCWWGEWC